MSNLSPQAIREAKADNHKMRDRDLADQLGISEGELVAAHVGYGATKIKPHPDDIMPRLSALGDVMALTRNVSAVHERVGTYGEYHSNKHAQMVLGKEIDLRIFAKYWTHGFIIDEQTDNGPRRAIQVFDAAGDAVHKVFLREESNHNKWGDLVQALKLDDQTPGLSVEHAAPVEAPKENPKKRDILLKEWSTMTDTHQFFRLCSKVGMNRLGAYHQAKGTQWVRSLAPDAMNDLLQKTSDTNQETILFVGNKGNIQIHWGQLNTITPMGPWLNVLDPRFNLHLRGDHIAELYAVKKPTKRGDALSIEAFDQNGMLICQIFGQRHEGDNLENWRSILDTLPDAPITNKV